MDILRFITAGSVDDGKSTLIGRILYDSKSLLDDQLEAIQNASRKNDDGSVDLALLTDGLRAEREQGITIDVAYKYFHTPRRKFIIADTPGHIQYTRNMVTGASNSDLAIILIDARKGVIEQTCRHSYICSLLGIPHFVLAINKMDLVDYSEEVFNKIVADYKQFTAPLGIKEIAYIPVSATNGDNVVDASANMPWYTGKPLLKHLEEVNLENDINFDLSRFQVQWVIRPQTKELPDYRGYAGKVMSGTYKKGDKVSILPSGLTSTIKAVEFDNQEVEEIFAPMSAVIHLEDEIDISRGDMIAQASSAPVVTQDIKATLCWMDTKALNPSGKYLIRQNSRVSKCIVKELVYKTNVNTLEKTYDAASFQLNDIGEVVIRTANPLCVDDYKTNRSTGSFVLVDEATNTTVGAGMISLV